MRNTLFSLALLASLSSCATTYRDFKMKHVEKNYGVAIGTVNVKYNGKEFTEQCSVCLYSLDGPCQKLTKEGLVFLAVKQGENSVRRIVCKDTSQHHYNIEGATFTQGEGVTYFGRAEIEWQNAGGFKTTDLFGALGAVISATKNDGTIKMAVSPGKMPEVIKAFEEHTKQKNVMVNKSIAKVGK
jgi:hypothetical protein